jgi:hypothetical protein
VVEKTTARCSRHPNHVAVALCLACGEPICGRCARPTLVQNGLVCVQACHYSPRKAEARILVRALVAKLQELGFKLEDIDGRLQDDLFD